MKRCKTGCDNGKTYQRMGDEMVAVECIYCLELMAVEIYEKLSTRQQDKVYADLNARIMETATWQQKRWLIKPNNDFSMLVVYATRSQLLNSIGLMKAGYYRDR